MSFSERSTQSLAQFAGYTVSFTSDSAKGRRILLLPEHRRILECCNTPRRQEWSWLIARGSFAGSEQHRDLLTLLPDIPGIYAAWKAIVRDYKVQGVKVYDARLVALMSVYAIEAILTFNDTDFKRYGGITAIHPSSVIV